MRDTDSKFEIDDSLNMKIYPKFYRADVLNNRTDALYDFKY